MPVRFGAFAFDPKRRTLRRDGEIVDLPLRALEVLACLLERPGETVTKDELFERVWGQAVVMDHSLTEAVHVLRQGLGDDARDPHYIQTVSRRGYRFIGTLEDSATGTEIASSTTTEAAPTAAAAPSIPAWAVVATTAVVVAVVAGAGLWRTEPGEDAVEVAFTLAERAPIDLRYDVAAALSPDGETLAFVSAGAEPGGVPRLWIQRRDEHEATLVADTEDAIQPFFSPDGVSVGFWVPADGGRLGPEWHHRLMTVPVGGGPATEITETRESFPAGASWGDDDAIVIAPHLYGGLEKVSLAGGERETLTTLTPDGDVAHRWPEVLPGGDAVVFTIPSGVRNSGASDSKIALLDLETGEWAVLIESGAFARYSPSGHLVFARDDQIVAVEFDLVRKQVTSDAVRLRDDVLIGAIEPAFMLSDNDLLYVQGPAPRGSKSLAWVTPGGPKAGIEWIDAPEGDYTSPMIAPDGTRFAATMSGVHDELRYWHLQVHELDGAVRSRLTNDVVIGGAVWTSNTHLVYAARDHDGWRLVEQSLTEGQGPRTLWSGDGRATSVGSMGPDGLLAFTKRRRETFNDVVVLQEADPTEVPFRATRSHERFPSFSPDGDLIAFEARQRGDDRWQVFVARFDEGAADVQVSTDGGTTPAWDPASGRLYYTSYDTPSDTTTLFAATILDDGELRVENRERLLEIPHLISGARFSVAPDGRLLMALGRYDRPVLESRLQLVVNWPALLPVS